LQKALAATNMLAMLFRLLYCSRSVRVGGFRAAGQALPPINPGVVASAFPDLSWGILLFDVLVMNHDK
jgi:hypothetical protein